MCVKNQLSKTKEYVGVHKVEKGIVGLPSGHFAVSWANKTKRDNKSYCTSLTRRLNISLGLVLRSFHWEGRPVHLP